MYCIHLCHLKERAKIFFPLLFHWSKSSPKNSLWHIIGICKELVNEWINEWYVAWVWEGSKGFPMGLPNLTFSDSFPFRNKHALSAQGSEFFKKHLSLSGYRRGEGALVALWFLISTLLCFPLGKRRLKAPRIPLVPKLVHFPVYRTFQTELTDGCAKGRTVALCIISLPSIVTKTPEWCPEKRGFCCIPRQAASLRYKGPRISLCSLPFLPSGTWKVNITGILTWLQVHSRWHMSA